MEDGQFNLWLEFELWEEISEEDRNCNYFNMQIKINNNNSYALNVWTFEYFEKALIEIKTSGENLNGRYLCAPDLFVERMDRDLIEQCVKEMIKNKTLKEEWIIKED